MRRNNCKPFNSFTTGNSSLNGIHSSINLLYFDRRVIAIKIRPTTDTPIVAEHDPDVLIFFLHQRNYILDELEVTSKLFVRLLLILLLLVQQHEILITISIWENESKEKVEIFFLEKYKLENGLTTWKCPTCFSFYCYIFLVNVCSFWYVIPKKIFGCCIYLTIEG